MAKNVIDLRKKDAPKRLLASQAPASAAPRKKAKRVSPNKRRRQKLRTLWAGLFVIACCAATYGISYVSYMPQYNVSAAAVSGPDASESAQVQTFVDGKLHDGTHPFISKDSVFVFDKRALAKEIVAAFPQLANASVSGGTLGQGSLSIRLADRQPYALWCADAQESDCYSMDSGGFVFAPASAPIQPIPPGTASTSAASIAPGAASSSPAAPGMYVFEGGFSDESQAEASSAAATTTETTNASPVGQTFIPAHFPGILALLQLLKENGFSPTSIAIESQQDFTIYLSNQPFYIKASFGEDAYGLVKNLNLVLSSDALQNQAPDLEYVDLRFGDRIYYKLQGQAESQSSQ